ncbi:MAG: hypothetical protein LUE98_02030 [Tannerellaceae bacterium]|nr:hypothetical protein [Tannerellaceae bacterium]
MKISFLLAMLPVVICSCNGLSKTNSNYFFEEPARFVYNKKHIDENWYQTTQLEAPLTFDVKEFKKRTRNGEYQKIQYSTDSIHHVKYYFNGGFAHAQCYLSNLFYKICVYDKKGNLTEVSYLYVNEVHFPHRTQDRIGMSTLYKDGEVTDTIEHYPTPQFTLFDVIYKINSEIEQTYFNQVITLHQNTLIFHRTYNDGRNVWRVHNRMDKKDEDDYGMKIRVRSIDMQTGETLEDREYDMNNEQDQEDTNWKNVPYIFTI